MILLEMTNNEQAAQMDYGRYEEGVVECGTCLDERSWGEFLTCTACSGTYCDDACLEQHLAQSAYCRQMLEVD